MAVSGPVGVEQPLQPVRAGGPGRPIAVALTLAAILAALIWQPWGGSARSPSVPPVPSAVAAAPSGAAPSATASVIPAPSSGPTPSPRGPRPSFGPGGSGTPVSATYVSLGDNEWSVVALLAPDKVAAADQPWVPDATGSLQPPGGSLLVLQLPASYTDRPIDAAGDPAAVCRARSSFRYYVGAHFPANRVAYLGVTFPGMDPRARVSGVVLDRRGLALKRLSVVSVRLSGMIEGVRYTVPTAGSGGAALFVLAPRAIMPVAAYRFDIVTPGVPGHRYLYACIDP